MNEVFSRSESYMDDITLFDCVLYRIQGMCAVINDGKLIELQKDAADEIVTGDKAISFHGVAFYCDQAALSSDTLDRLEEFSLSAEDTAYSVYMDNGRLVVY